MKLSDYERVGEMRRYLEAARGVLREFEGHSGPTVPCFARCKGGGYGRGATTELLPVAKEIAVSAARRDVAQIISQLAQLGVELDEPEGGE